MAEHALVGDVRGLAPSAALSDHDVYLLREGTHTRLYEKLGAHIRRDGKASGAAFAVSAPNAEAVSVIGDFNGWERARHPLAPRPDGSGIWEGFIGGVRSGARYKDHNAARHGGHPADKGHPFALSWGAPPLTASPVLELD